MADDLKRKRGFAKASLTRLENNVLQMNDATTSIDIAVQLEQLEKIYANLTSLDEDIIQAENSDKHSEIADYERRYFAAKSKLRTLFKKQSEREINEQMSQSIGRLSEQQKELVQSLHETSFIQKDDVKLQAVHIPPFSVQVFEGLMQGEAFDLIRHMKVTESNYDEAWSKVVQRYDVKDQISSSLVKQFLDQPQSSGLPRSVRSLADKTDEVLRGLKALGTEAEGRDVWLNYILLQKCDVETRRAWALHNDEAFPPIESLLKFLVRRTNALERAEPYQPRRSMQKRPMTNLNMRTSSSTAPLNSNMKALQQTANTTICCPKCNNEHYLYSCEEFIKLPLETRREFIASKGLCFICMKSSHHCRNCRSKYRCNICKGRHNSLLHVQRAVPTDTNSQSTEISNQSELRIAHLNAMNYSAAILPTALMRVKDALGNFHPCKAILDSGSQATFIEAKLSNKLQLPTQKARIAVSGLATKGLVTRGILELQIYPRDNEEECLTTKALILDRMSLVSSPPQSLVHVASDLLNINLADSEFYSTARIQLLLGADVFFSILRSGQHISKTFIAQNTIFGFVIVGNNATCTSDEPISLNLQLDMNIENTLSRFWQIEESPLHSSEDTTDHPAEEHFKRTFRRAPDGKFIVKLPFKEDKLQLENSYFTALKRLDSMQRKLSSSQNLRDEYTKFIIEYEALGHMRRWPLPTDGHENTYYLPPHAVIRQNSATTKLRVVFDGSCRTSNGTSLNNSLMVGPTIQPTLWAILLQFRKHKYVITADIQKMYRQIWVDESDINYQRILWRQDGIDPIQIYQLLTVTYGTACAPFLVTRCLKQVALEETNPIVRDIILKNFYVDDLLTGADTQEALISIKRDLTLSLAKAGFKLHKWASNVPDGTTGEPTESLQLPIEQDYIIKILGLQWIPKSDCFTFKVEPMKDRTQTKRIMLSESSRIFDPLGWISPSIVICKTIFQQLWLRKISWDDELPIDLNNQWRQLRHELSLFEQIRIPRFMNHVENEELIEYHGFADASQVAYTAVVYCRIQMPDKTFKVSLVTAKSRVAPLKTVSIPRLELCAAQLLSELILKVAEEFSIKKNRLFVWTDSMVVLAWLSSHPSNWKQFIRNRTSRILERLPRKHWNYVSTKCNPADLASRRVRPSRLIQELIWWEGPQWLSLDRKTWPNYDIVDTFDTTDKELNEYLQFIN